MFYFATTNIFLEISEGAVVMGLLFFGAGYLLSQFKAGRSKGTEDNGEARARLDQTLHDLISAQDKKYTILDAEHKSNLKEIGVLQGKVTELSKQQKWFESIMVKALEGFFEENPKVAQQINGKIINKKTKVV